MIVINLYLSRRHQFIRGFVSQMHGTDIENRGFIFVCSLDSKLAWGWWGSVWKRREQKKEEDKDRRRQRVLRAGAAERWYTIVIDHTHSKQLRMCVICGGLWGFEFPPTVASFYAQLCVCGRRQIPVQCDPSADTAHNRWAKVCVCPSARGYHHSWKILWRQKLTDLAVCKRTKLNINKHCNINKLNKIQLFNQCQMIWFKQSLKSVKVTDSYSDGSYNLQPSWFYCCWELNE